MGRGIPRTLVVVAISCGIAVAASVELEGTTLELRIDPLEATIGQRVDAVLEVTLGPGIGFEPGEVGTQLGPFRVSEGRWHRDEPTAEHAGERWTWTAKLAAFEIGELTVPPIRLQVSTEDGTATLESEEIPVRIVSVLDPGEDVTEGQRIADIKPPISLAADYAPLEKALIALAALVATAVAAWWLHRRYGARLTATVPPPDPFERLAPHVWAYRELKDLMESRLAEHGQIDRFFQELASIMKRYMGGRYRVELMEHTTEEVPRVLNHGGAPGEPSAEFVELLSLCDRVKFAGAEVDVPTCRATIEHAYRIVDATRPPESSTAEASQGAA